MKRFALFSTIIAIPIIISVLAEMLFLTDKLVNPLVISLRLVVIILSLFSVIALFLAMNDSNLKKWQDAYLLARSKFVSYFWVNILVSLIVTVGFLLLVIPGIYLGVLYSLANLVVVLENKRGWNVLKRSAELVKGHWWELFFRFFVIILLVLILSIVIFMVISLFKSKVLILFAQGIIQILVTPFMGAYLYLIYKELV